VRYPVIIAAAIALALPAGLAAQATSQPQAPAPSGGTTTPVTTAPSTQGVTPVMGQSRLTGDQIASWFATQKVTPRITIPMVELARMFVDEGNAQNVRGDIAFVQSILETGWFRYEGSMVKPEDNNYSGLGACDSCSRGNIFKTPQDGVRAQIQHLRNYGDPASRAANLAHPPSPYWYAPTSLDPAVAAANFDSFFAKGWALTWNQMGRGNWATDPGYAQKVLTVYGRMVAFATGS